MTCIHSLEHAVLVGSKILAMIAMTTLRRLTNHASGYLAFECLNVGFAYNKL